MKKLFIAALALASVVACSKDDVQGPALDSANKSISITIMNGSATRANDAGVTEASNASTHTSAEATELQVLFLNGDNILQTLPLVNTDTGNATNESHGVKGEYVPGTTGEQNTYIWHNVPWEVNNIAVVRVDAELDKDIAYTKASEYETLAASEDANLTRELNEIVLYGIDTNGLEDMKTTHEVDGVSYHYWKAEVTVTPKLARFEINNIQCEDLGALNADENLTTYGFDELVINSVTWNSKYTIATDELGTLYGSYAPASATNRPTPANNFIKPADVAETPNTEVWSWNVDPQNFSNLVVDMKASAYDYTVAEGGKSVPLTVTGLASTQAKADANENDVTKFDAANIYKLDLKFKEGNIASEDKLCVQVEVKITPWTVKTVYPVFGN